jgi:hypothetical protein
MTHRPTASCAALHVLLFFVYLSRATGIKQNETKRSTKRAAVGSISRSVPRVDFIAVASNHGSGSSTFVTEIITDLFKIGSSKRCAVLINEPFSPQGRIFAQTGQPQQGLFFDNGTSTGTKSNGKYSERAETGIKELGKFCKEHLGSCSACVGMRSGEIANHEKDLGEMAKARLSRVPALAEQAAHGIVDVFTLFSEIREAVCEIIRSPDCIIVHKAFPIYAGEVMPYAHFMPYLTHPRVLTIQLERNETEAHHSNWRRFQYPSCMAKAKSGVSCDYVPTTQLRDPWATFVEKYVGIEDRIKCGHYVYVPSQAYFTHGYKNLAKLRRVLALVFGGEQVELII